MAGPNTAAAGKDHTCVVMKNATNVRCFGKNQHGQLGYGDTMTRGRGIDSMPPPVVNLGLNISLDGMMVYQIGAGGDHTCIVTSLGAVKCWGRGSYGQLGYGTRTHLSSVPI